MRRNYNFNVKCFWKRNEFWYWAEKIGYTYTVQVSTKSSNAVKIQIKNVQSYDKRK